MNERIKELVGQAGGYVCLSYEHDGQLILSGEDIVQKFAELIIRECVSKIGDVYKDALDDVMDDWDGGFLGGLSCAMDAVQNTLELKNEPAD